MKIQRVDGRSDGRFSANALRQHGCFLIDSDAYEAEIISEDSAMVRGRDSTLYPAVIEEFRFYAPHITKFYDDGMTLIASFPPARIIEVSIKDIQPSQFYVDEDKVSALEGLIGSERDIVIQVLKAEKGYISLDGHTRLYIAVRRGFSHVYAVESETDEYIFDFVNEARCRGIFSPADLKPLSHEEYAVKWNKYCDDYFSRTEAT